MYSIETSQPSEEFSRCWFSAARHLNTMSQKGLLSWVKIDLTDPFHKHISLQMGDQLFFIRIVDVEGQIEPPEYPTGVEHKTDKCGGFACLMPMRRRAGEWTPDKPRWGLLDARSGQPINPVAEI